MELKKESPITYSNGKRLFTVEQKVDALVRIKMTGCSKAEVARSLHVAESTFRGWFKNKDIVMKAEVKYNEMKLTKGSSSASSDGYKSDDNNSKSFSVSDGSDNISSTLTDDRENSRSRFSSPDIVAPARRSPAPPRRLHHHKQKLKKLQQQQQQLQQPNVNSLGNVNVNNNNNNNNNHNHNNNNHVVAANGGGLAAGVGAAAAAAAAAGMVVGGFAAGPGFGLCGNGGSISQQQKQLEQHLTHLAAQHPLHTNLSSLGGLKGTSAAAAFAAAAAMAAAATAGSDPANLSPAEFHSKLNSYFNPSPLLATSFPGSISFLPPNFTTAENSYNSSSSFINTMVTATLMEPQALDLSTHSRNKCKDPESLLTAGGRNPVATAQTGPKILRHNSYRKLFKPYKNRCTDDVVHARQGINPINPLRPLQ